MSINYAVSLNGIQNAEIRLEGAARRIASSNLHSSEASANRVADSDLVTDLAEVNQAKIAEKANLCFLSKQDELEQNTLDIFT